MLEKVFEGGGIGEEVPGYGAELRLEDHPLSPEGVSFLFSFFFSFVAYVPMVCVDAILCSNGYPNQPNEITRKLVE